LGCDEEQRLIFESAEISGQVSLFDDLGRNVDNSNMKISLWTDNALTDTTDTKGKFSIPNVTPGNYQLVFEKEGFGIFIHFDIDHVDMDGPTVLNDTIRLSKLSTTEVRFLEVKYTGSELLFLAHIDPPGTIDFPRKVRYFFSEYSSVSMTNYNQSLRPVVITTETSKACLRSGDLYALSQLTDSTIYVKAYGESHYANDYRPIGNEWQNVDYTHYPNLNPIASEAIDFVVP
jgi:hypothetical protein